VYLSRLRRRQGTKHGAFLPRDMFADISIMPWEKVRYLCVPRCVSRYVYVPVRTWTGTGCVLVRRTCFTMDIDETRNGKKSSLRYLSRYACVSVPYVLRYVCVWSGLTRAQGTKNEILSPQRPTKGLQTQIRSHRIMFASKYRPP
jgi:hypothetical protein